MTFPTRWNPFRQMERFDPFADIADTLRAVGRPWPQDMETALEMRMDVVEDDKAYRVSIDMPGVRKENIEVDVQGNQVSVSAEVRREQNADKERQVHRERYEGRAFRAFTLPAEVDSNAAKAEYDGGVLVLTLPKREGNGGKRLAVN